MSVGRTTEYLPMILGFCPSGHFFQCLFPPGLSCPWDSHVNLCLSISRGTTMAPFIEGQLHARHRASCLTTSQSSPLVFRSFSCVDGQRYIPFLAILRPGSEWLHILGSQYQDVSWAYTYNWMLRLVNLPRTIGQCHCSGPLLQLSIQTFAV